MVDWEFVKQHSNLLIAEGPIGDPCTFFPVHRLIVTNIIVCDFPEVFLISKTCFLKHV